MHQEGLCRRAHHHALAVGAQQREVGGKVVLGCEVQCSAAAQGV